MTDTLTAGTYAAARGRWREVLLALGFPAAAVGKKHQPCPLCGGTDRYRFTDRTGDGDYICSQCGAGKGIKLLMGFKGWDFKQAAQEVDAVVGNLPETKRVQIRTVRPASTSDFNALWQRGAFLGENSVADKYLVSRGIKAMHNPALRWVALLKHIPTRTLLPCLLARFSDPDGNPMQIHRTYLTSEGRKAPQDPHMFMPGPLPKGGAIRLGPMADTMGIAEGIETALSASQLFGMPVWATTSEVMLRAWEPPKLARHVVVFGDNDENLVGQHAAYELGRRLVHAGFVTAVKIPVSTGQDWNDVLVEGKQQ